ncbi:16S rRNA (cytosine(1402)-N(4))-methyltransferase RsmH [Actinomycetospora corticicola]|uniref:Ribosomal RNA small subunit methyltransferase H n=2 Tax=Actinomycetospora corticicola TaxID=663602 RepID=A0A7Y9J5C2_9PSEU|nr:16S rRNA (cytosine1402-N4)-methyltransferase [Actinomycetospora corticicola]
MDPTGPSHDDASQFTHMRTTGERHVPVLLERCLELLAPALDGPDAVVVDGTLGLGGHAEALLTRHPGLTLVGLDRDPEALRLAGERLAPHAGRIHLVHAVFDEIADVLDRLGLGPVQGVLFDLGVSSLQLDEDQRGFSYSREAPLDMRMDPTTGPSAADVLNSYAPGELVRVLRDYGEERAARRIVEAVVRARRRAPLRTSAELVALLEQAMPAASRRTGGHPAKRTFQALRIEVNGELDAIAGAIPAAVDALALHGRLVVMSYQSLEDRIVKRVLTQRSQVTAPPDMPVLRPEDHPELALLTRGAEKADEAEIAANPRAASVRLRAAERVREAA